MAKWLRKGKRPVTARWEFGRGKCFLQKLPLFVGNYGNIVNVNLGIGGVAVHAGAAGGVGLRVDELDHPGSRLFLVLFPDFCPQNRLARAVLSPQLEGVPD